MKLLIGVKLGQNHEYSAVCVAQNPQRQVQGRREYHFEVRFLDRIPPGTSFPDVAERVAEIVKNAVQKTGGRPSLYIDVTGLGQPIVDLVAPRVPSAQVLAVFFNHGDRREANWKEVKLGKAFIVARLQMLLQSQRLHIPRTAESEILTKELLDYHIQVEEHANDRNGAFSVGTHDDLITALGLAVQDDGAPRCGVLPFQW